MSPIEDDPPKDVPALRNDPVAKTLGQVIMDAVKEAEAMRAAGAEPAAVAKALETVVREHWPKPHDGRTEPWKHLCEDCDDTGWRRSSCAGDATCGRPKPHGPHDYVSPCWCEKGRTMQPKAKPTPEDFGAAAKSKPLPKRWGR